MFKKKIQNLVWYIRRELTKIPPSPIRLMWERAAEESADFISSYTDTAMLFHDKRKLWDFSLSSSSNEGLFIECGVFDGTSLNYMARKKPGQKFYGFDSFEGLEEDWVGHHKIKGSFDLQGKLPNVEHNVELIKGWLSDTFQTFLAEKGESISFLHIDTDTYSPAKLILEKARPFLRKGSVILFDELQGYPNWKNGEFKALQENLPKDTYEFIGFSTTQAAIKIRNEKL